MTAAQLERLDRFAAANGLASREHAAASLLDSALTSAEASVPLDQARTLADRLRAEGYASEADRLQTATTGQWFGHALLEALREACQTILTTMEALDPKTQLLAEELRLEIDKRLQR